MGFYKRIDEEIVCAPNSVDTPTYSLNKEQYLEYEYPIDGWYWFESLEEAIMSNVFLQTTTIDRVDSWQARYLLASTPPTNVGMLVNFSGNNLLEQIDKCVAYILTAPELEKYKGAKTWFRNDPMLIYLMSNIGLSEIDIDNWFIQASKII